VDPVVVVMVLDSLRLELAIPDASEYCQNLDQEHDS